MRINVHAGHNPDGKVACGAVGIIRESTEARNVKNEVIRQLKALGHTVYDCTCDNGTSQSNVLSKILQMCNDHAVDIDVSIHFNSGAGNVAGNGKTTGVEVYVYDTASKAKSAADNVCRAIASLGFKNRGVKINKNLYVLNRTKASAMLIECCFVDDRDDVQQYDCCDMASAIVYGLTGQTYEDKSEIGSDQDAASAGAETPTGDAKQIYRVQVGAYGIKSNAETMQVKLKAAGFDAILVKS